MRNSSENPFRDHTLGLDASYNAFLGIIQSEHHLPLLHGSQLCVHAGKWREFFATKLGWHPQALIVEIGCYKGKNLSEMAARYPQTAFIGIDLTFKRVVLTAQLLQKMKLQNAVSVLIDANYLDFLCKPDELDGIICFFPDPWPKRKQLKNRLFSPRYGAKISHILRTDGFVWLKTDHAEYYAQTVQSLQEQGFHTLKTEPEELQSRFEHRFKAKNIKIHSCILINQKPPIPSMKGIHQIMNSGSNRKT